MTLTLLFLVGLFLGASLGFLCSCLCTIPRQSEIRAECNRCHQRHMDALLRAGVDTRWETDRR